MMNDTRYFFDLEHMLPCFFNCFEGLWDNENVGGGEYNKVLRKKEINGLMVFILLLIGLILLLYCVLYEACGTVLKLMFKKLEKKKINDLILLKRWTHGGKYNSMTDQKGLTTAA